MFPLFLYLRQPCLCLQVIARLLRGPDTLLYLARYNNCLTRKGGLNRHAEAFLIEGTGFFL